jgi:PAS domain S-box-containing protein
MNAAFNVLILEGNEPSVGHAESLLERCCEAASCRRIRSDDLDTALEEGAPDLVLADYASPGADFVGALHVVCGRAPDVPVILITGSMDERQASELLELGVWDFLLREDLHRLPHLLTHALRERAHRRAEQAADVALERSEGRYRQVFLNASDSLFVFPLSPDGQPGQFTDVNKAAAEMLGYSCEELLKLSPPDLLDPGELAALPQKFRDLLLEKRQHVALTMMSKDGRRIPVEISGTLFDLESHPTVLGIVTDVTGKKRAADMFHKATDSAIRRHRIRARIDAVIVGSLSLLVLLVSSSFHTFEDVGSWVLEHPVVEPGLVTLSFLASALVIYGWRRRRDINAEATARARVDEALHALQGELETRVHRRTAELLEANNGLRTEIAERERAESVLHLQGAALDASADAIIITDADGRIAWVNPAFTGLTGYAAAEAVGRSPGDLLKSGAQDEVFYRDMWKTIAAGRAWRGEMTNRRKDGTLYSENMTIAPVRSRAGAVTHFVAIKRDLTEEKRLKAQFLQAQKMESVGRLAGGIAHDFNNLLTVINGTAELACSALPDDDPLHADFSEIHRAGQRAAALTRQLLAFSRKQVMKPQLLNPATLVADLRSLLQRVIGEDVSLVILPEGSTSVVKADPGHLEQVLMNLVVNARDAMPHGGTVTIETKDVDITASRNGQHESISPGSYVVISVRDTGTGMDEQTRARLFEPFFTTKEQGKGTGLGLATVYGIVEQSGGYIAVDTAPGKGTTFTIYLPQAVGTASGRPRVSAAPLAEADETILVVEDEPGVQEMARRMLTAGGYTVLTANNGADALRLLDGYRRTVHLMLSDVVMPGMSGPDLAARAAETRPRMKVLFTSGYTENAALRTSAGDHSRAFIGKPYKMAELMRKVRETLDAPATRTMPAAAAEPLHVSS